MMVVSFNVIQNTPINCEIVSMREGHGDEVEIVNAVQGSKRSLVDTVSQMYISDAHVEFSAADV